MDDEIDELLRLVAAMVPAEVRSDAGLSVTDVLEYLEYREWELALDILTDFDGNTWQTPRYWDLLAEVTTQMELDPAWCRWRCAESIHGLLRVDLMLGHDADPLPAQGARPTWDLTGDNHRVAAVWMTKELEAGGRATARLRPLVPEAWSHLAKGDVITLQGRSPGIAKVVEKSPPRP